MIGYLTAIHGRRVLFLAGLLASGCLTSCGLHDRSRILETHYYTAKNRETLARITGTPTFEEHSGLYYLSIKGLDPDRYRSLYWPKEAPNPASFDTSKVWTLEILYQESLTYDFTRAEMLKASISGQVIFDSSICEVHHCKMSRVVEVCDEYADRLKPGGFEHFVHIRSSRFPHSGTSFPACTEYPGRELTWQCADCKKAAKQWGDRHLKNQPFI